MSIFNHHYYLVPPNSSQKITLGKTMIYRKIIKSALVVLAFNGIFMNALNSQTSPCSSMGTDTSFEHIAQVTLNTLDNLSGNNGGYGDFSDLSTELEVGKSYEITLTPGYKDSEFNESWNIWIDYNNDGDYEDEGEEVLSIIAAGQIISTIDIPKNITSRAKTSMRVSMKYVSAALPCQIFSFGEVEDYTILLTGEIEPCSDIITDGFESSYKNWIDGGIDCSRVIENAISGEWSVRLRDNSGEASSLTTKDLALSAYEEITIDFFYYPYSMEDGEDFWLQISTDGGISFTTIKTWTSGKEFINKTRYSESVSINNVTFSDKTRIRLRCDASANADQVYIDDIIINACSTEIQETGIANIDNQEELEADLAIISSIENKPSTQIKSEKDAAFTIYPNPARESISFKLTEGKTNDDSFSIKMLDSHGNIVKYQTNVSSMENFRLDITELINGIYFVMIDNGEGVTDSHKIIVSK